MEKPPSVFLSYAREDHDVAMRLYRDLMASGARPWIDSEDLLPGHLWPIEIEREIRSTDFFLVLLSKNSVSKKGYVQKEVLKALEVLDLLPEASRFIIPVRLDDCRPMHRRLEDIHQADLFPSYEKGFERILLSILPDSQNTGRVKYLEYPNDEDREEDRDLSVTGWGVVFATGISAEVRRGLAPLLSLRSAQACERYYDLTCDPGESAFKFFSRIGVPPGPVDPDRFPLYVLIVGDPSEISWSFQQQLAVRYRVGRISFDSSEHYRMYATSVVEIERLSTKTQKTMTFFGVENPGSEASRRVCRQLIEPLYTTLDRRFPDWSIRAELGASSTKSQLVSILAQPPKLLFIGAHGKVLPCGDWRQLDEQGAILCGDWPGTNHPVGHEHWFLAEDVPRSANLSGCLAFLFCGYSCGVAEFDETSSELGGCRVAPRAFVSRLAQQLLSNPGGTAIAVIGTVGRLWTSSFSWNGEGGHIGTFKEALGTLLAGGRIGAAFEHFSRRYSELSAEYARLAYLRGSMQEVNPEEFADASLTMHDAKGFVVLGDPAARIH